MKITLNEIVNSVTPLNNLNKQLIPAKVAFRLAILFKKLTPIIDTYNEKHNEILLRYGNKINNDQVQILEENKEQYTKEYKDLLNENVEIDIEKIKLIDIENVNITTNDMVNLDWLITE